jgi:hypothetical protein
LCQSLSPAWVKFAQYPSQEAVPPLAWPGIATAVTPQPPLLPEQSAVFHAV